MTALHISPDLELPLDAATGTFGVLATKGAGKSNAAVVMAEEMYDAGIPWVAIDPKGDWYGIRSAGNGQHPGLPIVVFGGRHGDVPLEPTAGALIADLVLGQRLTCVLDVSQFTKADTTRFLLAFGKRIFTHADDDGPEPLHLFLEEAHEYLPQRVPGDVADLVNVWQRIVKQGRFKGLGCTLISQRSSVLNKDVLELIDTLVVLRTIGPRSRQSIAEWVKDQDVDPGLMASLPSLADGEAWVWSPGALGILQRIRFRRRRTFDSGATPKVGESRRTPATLADVDLAAIKEQMADTIERAKADDPKQLRKMIAELGLTVHKLEGERDAALAAIPEPIVEIIDVPLLDPQLVERVELAIGELRALGEHFTERADVLVENLGAAKVLHDHARGAYPPPDRAGREDRKAPTPPADRQTNRGDIPAVARPARTNATTGDADPKLGKRERALLTVLAQYPHGRTHRQLALLTGYSAKASTIAAGLSALRKLGYIEPSGNPVLATAEGITALGAVDPLPTGQALYDYWRTQLGQRERVLLEHLVRIYPESSNQATAAEATGYSPEASTIGAGMSKLRGLGLVDGWHASDDFMDSIRA